MLRLPTHTNPVFATLAACGLASAGVNLIVGHELGVGFLIFLALTAAAATASNGVRAPASEIAVGGAILAFGLLPVCVVGGEMANGLALISLTVYLIAITRYGADGRGSSLNVLIHACLGGFGMPRVVARTAATFRIPPRMMRTALGWLIPASLTLGFVALLAIANPMIEHGLDLIAWPSLTARPDPTMVLFWMGLTFAVWPAVYFRPRETAPHLTLDPNVLIQNLAPNRVADYLNPPTILRCLVLFNLVFVLQTASDLVFLWGGASLPSGMTAASYAHRGAYPLVATALLAAVFVLVALRSHDATPRGRTTRRLVYLWIAQNIFLVIASIQRLEIYVGHYALTLLRAAAFVWMALVAVGLALILVRIARGYSSGWLVRANLAVLALTLYGCTFVSFSAVVAEANVDHALRGDSYTALDVSYLMDLGPDAIPALDRYAATLKPMPSYFKSWRDQNVKTNANSLRDWRGWTFRRARLSEYLANDPYPPRAATDTAIPCDTADCGGLR